jgi:hypothetical protein
MATIAVFIALGGGAYAAFSLPKNSVKSKHIVNGQVKPQDLSAPAATQSAGLPSPDTFCQGGVNAWQNADYTPVEYFRDRDGVVHLSGIAIACGNAPSSIFTLPPGYRPEFARFLAAWDPGAFEPRHMNISAAESGSVDVNPNPGEQYSLDGISFRCGPSGQDGCP